jgi:hypothetical protein
MRIFYCRKWSRKWGSNRLGGPKPVLQPGGLKVGSRWSFPAFPGTTTGTVSGKHRIPEGCQRITKNLRTRYSSIQGRVLGRGVWHPFRMQFFSVPLSGGRSPLGPGTTTGYLLASLRDASYRRIFPVQPGGLEDGSRWSFPAFPGNDHRNAAWRNQRIPEGCQKMTKDLRTRYQSQRIHPGDGGLAPLRGA